jgi:hypothetical protein
VRSAGTVQDIIKQKQAELELMRAFLAARPELWNEDIGF